MISLSELSIIFSLIRISLSICLTKHIGHSQFIIEFDIIGGTDGANGADSKDRFTGLFSHISLL